MIVYVSHQATALSSTVLLLHGDGTNGGTTFTDDSANNYSPTSSANVITSTADSVYGGSSIYFQNVADAHLTFPASTKYNNGTSFTIEFWMKIVATPPASTYFCSTSNVRYFTIESSGAVSSTGWGGNNLSLGTAATNTWDWYVIVFDNSSPRTSAYKNGTRTETGTGSPAHSTSTNEKLGIGSVPDVSFLNELKNVYIDDFRFSDIALYDASQSTITVQSSAWTN